MTDADLRDPDRRVTVATYEHYLTAQRAVDFCLTSSLSTRYLSSAKTYASFSPG